jgi:hypothetical protein
MKKLLLILISILLFSACDETFTSEISVINKSQSDITNLEIMSTYYDITILPNDGKTVSTSGARGGGFFSIDFKYYLNETRFICPLDEDDTQVTNVRCGESATILVYDNGYEIKNSAGLIIGEWRQ